MEGRGLDGILKRILGWGDAGVGGVRGGGSQSCCVSMIDESEKRGGGDRAEQILKPNLCFAEMCESRVGARRRDPLSSSSATSVAGPVLLCQAGLLLYRNLVVKGCASTPVRFVTLCQGQASGLIILLQYYWN